MRTALTLALVNRLEHPVLVQHAALPLIISPLKPLCLMHPVHACCPCGCISVCVSDKAEQACKAFVALFDFHEHYIRAYIHIAVSLTALI